MRGIQGFLLGGTAVLLVGCVSTPELRGTWGAPSVGALQQGCANVASVDYGIDEQSVYSLLFDAYVARRRGRVSQDDYCAFQASIAQYYTAMKASGSAQARNDWAAYLLAQRVKALSWRASVDPTLRGG
ncbi:hypothetical protein [Paraburkholderia hayleyella]|uniref:hypothetical protein n=1 Tax=Paraburkholderia hayleyella TaxID=2152889 RepID=UPI0015808AB9|nr:hypothetical protein [Paraburkholderia hayleyella]